MGELAREGSVGFEDSCALGEGVLLVEIEPPDEAVED